MPYKDRGKWRAVVKLKGVRYTEARPEWTKKDAVKWEVSKRAELLKLSTGTGWLTLALRYLDHARMQFRKTTYHEKNKVVSDFSLYLKGAFNMADLSALLVSEISSSHVQGYLMEQAETRGPKAANVDRKNLMVMWNWGEAILDIESNPVRKVPKWRTKRKPQHVPSEQDILRMLAVADARERAFLDCYLCTGARRAEIFQLTWEDVNFEHRTITLRTGKTRDGSEKTLILPMNQRLYDSLRWAWNNRQYKDSPYVWVIEEGQYGEGQPYSCRGRFLSRLAKRAGVQPFGFHSLRRYVATYLSDNEKVATKTVQRILGHASVQTTERYLYNAHQDLESVMELLGRDGEKGDRDCNDG